MMKQKVSQIKYWNNQWGDLIFNFIVMFSGDFDDENLLAEALKEDDTDGSGSITAI